MWSETVSVSLLLCDWSQDGTRTAGYFRILAALHLRTCWLVVSSLSGNISPPNLQHLLLLLLLLSRCSLISLTFDHMVCEGGAFGPDIVTPTARKPLCSFVMNMNEPRWDTQAQTSTHQRKLIGAPTLFTQNSDFNLRILTQNYFFFS